LHRPRLREHDNCDCRKAKQNADYDTEFKEPAFAKATADKFGSGFLFHRMKFGLIAGLRRNARERINAIFLLPVLLISLGSKSGASFLAERAETCQHYFWLYVQKRFGRRRHRPSNYDEFYGDL